MDDIFFDGLTTELYHNAKLGEDRIRRAGCRCDNVVFVSFFCNAPRPERCSLEGDIVRTGVALPFNGRFQQGLHIFSQGTALSDALQSSHFCC